MVEDRRFFFFPFFFSVFKIVTTNSEESLTFCDITLCVQYMRWRLSQVWSLSGEIKLMSNRDFSEYRITYTSLFLRCTFLQHLYISIYICISLCVNIIYIICFFFLIHLLLPGGSRLGFRETKNYHLSTCITKGVRENL